MAVIAFKMVLHKPEKVTVQKLFNLTGKVVAVTGKQLIDIGVSIWTLIAEILQEAREGSV